jgi:hypothetical protein
MPMRCEFWVAAFSTMAVFKRDLGIRLDFAAVHERLLGVAWYLGRGTRHFDGNEVAV